MCSSDLRRRAPDGRFEKAFKMSGIPAETLLLCLVCGVLLGFAFAVLEFLRLLFSLGKIAAAVTDVLFCLFAAVVTFLLSLAVSAGHARFFQIACEVIGFLCVQVTVTHGICRFLPNFCKMRARTAEKGGSIAKKREKTQIISEQIEKKQKKDLNNDGASLYNGTRKAAERSA